MSLVIRVHRRTRGGFYKKGSASFTLNSDMNPKNMARLLKGLAQTMDVIVSTCDTCSKTCSRVKDTPEKQSATQETEQNKKEDIHDAQERSETRCFIGS